MPGFPDPYEFCRIGRRCRSAALAALEIRHIPDVDGDAPGETVSVVIRIQLETEEPPTGTVSLEGREAPAFPFVGWLGLLRVLSQLFSSAGGP